MHEKIFIVEDEEKIRKELNIFLSRYDYDVTTTDDFENIVDVIFENNPHLVLLDINLPKYDGYYICKEIRRKSNIPIIVVTSRDSEVDELMSMNFGADDFITKPYNTNILLARISAVLKRTYNNELQIYSYKDLKYNLSVSEIDYKGQKSDLTKNESRIMYTLIKNKGNIVTRDDLIKSLWESDEFVDDNTLTVNVNRLRKKLEEIGAKDYIKTKRGQGYILL